MKRKRMKKVSFVGIFVLSLSLAVVVEAGKSTTPQVHVGADGKLYVPDALTRGKISRQLLLTHDANGWCQPTTPCEEEDSFEVVKGGWNRISICRIPEDPETGLRRFNSGRVNGPGPELIVLKFWTRVPGFKNDQKTQNFVGEGVQIFLNEDGTVAYRLFLPDETIEFFCSSPK